MSPALLHYLGTSVCAQTATTKDRCYCTTNSPLTRQAKSFITPKSERKPHQWTSIGTMSQGHIFIMTGRSISMNSCRGICHRYAIPKTIRYESHYLMGRKRCVSCEVYMDYEGTYCPCCGSKFRLRPRYGKYRKKQLLLQKVKRI